MIRPTIKFDTRPLHPRRHLRLAGLVWWLFAALALALCVRVLI